MKTREYSQKIIFIDDESSFADSLKESLEKEGAFFLHVKSAKEGVRKILTEKPDLVITDLMMPSMNGFDIIKSIRNKKDASNANIVILTNYGNKELEADKGFLKSLGISKYLIKSNYTKSELVNEIKNTLA